LFLLSVESTRTELTMRDITSWECSIDGTLKRRRPREPTLLMVAFVAFYRPPREPTDYSNRPYKYECFNYIMGFLSLEIFLRG
jgi:hypothetical protein